MELINKLILHKTEPTFNLLKLDKSGESYEVEVRANGKLWKGNATLNEKKTFYVLELIPTGEDATNAAETYATVTLVNDPDNQGPTNMGNVDVEILG